MGNFIRSTRAAIFDRVEEREQREQGERVRRDSLLLIKGEEARPGHYGGDEGVSSACERWYVPTQRQLGQSPG